MTAPPVIRPSRNGACRIERLASSSGCSLLVSATMIEKIMVVAPTTAVPISTGLAVALKVLPAPSFSSRLSLPFSKSGVKPKSFWISPAMFGMCLDGRQLEHRLRVVGHRAVGIHRDGHRPMPRNPNATRPNANTAGASISAPKPKPLIQEPMAIKRHHRQAQPVGAEVAGHQAGQNVERRAAFFATTSPLRARAASSSK